jgi:hypothetical protein
MKMELLKFKLSNLGRKSVLVLLKNGFGENLFFGSPEKLLK